VARSAPSSAGIVRSRLDRSFLAISASRCHRADHLISDGGANAQFLAPFNLAGSAALSKFMRAPRCGTDSADRDSPRSIRTCAGPSLMIRSLRGAPDHKQRFAFTRGTGAVILNPSSTAGVQPGIGTREATNDQQG
jgi:hypothetical protein